MNNIDFPTIEDMLTESKVFVIQGINKMPFAKRYKKQITNDIFNKTSMEEFFYMFGPQIMKCGMTATLNALQSENGTGAERANKLVGYMESLMVEANKYATDKMIQSLKELK